MHLLVDSAPRFPFSEYNHLFHRHRGGDTKTFITKLVMISGLGGRSSKIIPEIVKTARKKGIECLCVCIMPFSTEGEEACLSAEKILDQVKADADILIVLKNDWIQERYGDLLINQAFHKMDTLVYKLISNYITNG